MTNLTAFDLFSGGGGFRQGAEKAGVKIVGFCEKDKYAAKFYKQAYDTEKELFFNDATKIVSRQLPDFDILLAGFPCQAFSIAGKRQGFKDTRGTLFFDVARILRDKRPKYFLLENVKGLLSHDNGKTFQTILKILADTGFYSIEWSLLNSKFFGVPQNRERVFVVGYPRKLGIGKIFPICGASSKNTCTSQKESIVYWKNSKEKWTCENRNDVGTIRTQSDLCRQPMIMQLSRGYNKGGLKDVAPTITKNQWEYNNLLVGSLRTYNDDKGFRPIKDDTCPCIPARARNDGSGQPVIVFDSYNQQIKSDGLCGTLTQNCGCNSNKAGFKVVQQRIRRLTPLECFRLQGYSDEAFYKGSKGIADTQLYKIAGNSVTVNVVYEILKKIVEIDKEQV